jgi:threonine aldolase
MVDRLAEDHANARRLAEGIAELRPEAVDLGGVETNIVMVRTTPFGLTPPQLTEEMAARGVKFFPFGPETVRMVTHKDVSADDIGYALEQLREVVR